MVNNLKAAGAEALAVNGLRIIAGSDIRCVGTVILVNSTRVAPPYEIQALGNAEALEAGIESSDEFIFLKDRDFPIKVTKNQSLTLPAYSGSFPLDNVRLLEAGRQE